MFLQTGVNLAMSIAFICSAVNVSSSHKNLITLQTKGCRIFSSRCNTSLLVVLFQTELDIEFHIIKSHESGSNADDAVVLAGGGLCLFWAPLECHNCIIFCSKHYMAT
jgi:hypothetical protein